MTLKSLTRNLVFPILLLLLPSCADSINNLSKESYMADGFSPLSLTRDGVAITPTAAGSGTAREAVAIGALLNAEMKKRTTGHGILLAASQVDHRIGKDNTLASLWKEMAPHISAHSVRGMEAARSFARILGVRFLFETQIQMAEIAGGAEQVRVYARIYDTRKDRIVWEGIGEGRGYEKIVFPSSPATFGVVAPVAVRGLVDSLYGH